MPRLALFNMIIGFFFLFLAASAGVFLSLEATQTFVSDATEIVGWRFTLLKSSHAHTNLFAMMQILFGLTIPYSRLGNQVKVLQTVGFCLGLLGMSFLMYLKSRNLPSLDIQILDIVLGISLSAALVALASHVLGLVMKLRSV